VFVLDLNDSIIAAWDMGSGARQELKICSEKLLKISGNGKWMVTVDDNSNYRLREDTNKRCDLEPLIAGDKIQRVNDISFSDDSKFLGIFYVLGTQRFFDVHAKYIVKDLTTMQNIFSKDASEGDDGAIQFSPLNRWVLFGDKYWNLRTGKGGETRGCEDTPTFSADETRLILSCGESGNIRIWDLDSGQSFLRLKAHDSGLKKVVLMRDQKNMLTVGKDVKLWRLQF
jgi:WD40 repeat protein